MHTLNQKEICVIILVVFFIAVIAYSIFLFECYKQSKFVFAPYKPPNPAPNTFLPMGEITPLTEAEIAHRNAILETPPPPPSS